MHFVASAAVFAAIMQSICLSLFAELHWLMHTSTPFSSWDENSASFFLRSASRSPGGAFSISLSEMSQ